MKGTSRYDAENQGEQSSASKAKLMVFGVICEQGPICFTVVPLKTKINQDTYQAMIKELVLPKIRSFEQQPGSPKVTFQQDGASSHTAHTTKDFFGRECVNLLQDWPPKSPDLSPIENIWGIMKQELSKHPALTLKELEERVVQAWQNACTAKTCKKLYESMRNRLELCIQNGGSRIRY